MRHSWMWDNRQVRAKQRRKARIQFEMRKVLYDLEREVETKVKPEDG